MRFAGKVDLSERIVRLEPGETKNDEARTIPLVPELYEMLKVLKETRDRYFPESPWVFSRAGERIRMFYKSWHTARERKQLEGLCAKHKLSIDGPNRDLRKRLEDREIEVREGDSERLFHDLRRTGVRDLIRAGVPERVAMRISGHKTRAIFDRYNIVDEADLQDAARRIGDYLVSKSAPEAIPES